MSQKKKTPGLRGWIPDLIAITILLLIMLFICKGIPAILNGNTAAADDAVTACITMATTQLPFPLF